MNQHTDRYWEGRWRDEKAHNDALVKALRELVDYGGTLSGWDDARAYAKQVLGAVGNAQWSGE